MKKKQVNRIKPIQKPGFFMACAVFSLVTIILYLCPYKIQYTQFILNQGRIQMFKKITLFTIFCLFILKIQTLWAIESSSGIQIKNLIDTSSSWNGDPINYPKGAAKITSMLVQMDPGAKTPNHFHQVPSFGYILEGEITVVCENQEHKKFTQGDIVIEVINKTHYGYNSGSLPAKFIVFYLGTDDLKNTIIQAK